MDAQTHALLWAAPSLFWGVYQAGGRFRKWVLRLARWPTSFVDAEDDKTNTGAMRAWFGREGEAELGGFGLRKRGKQRQ